MDAITETMLQRHIADKGLELLTSIAWDHLQCERIEILRTLLRPLQEDGTPPMGMRCADLCEVLGSEYPTMETVGVLVNTPFNELHPRLRLFLCFAYSADQNNFGNIRMIVEMRRAGYDPPWQPKT